eukprot:gene3525-3794_t
MPALPPRNAVSGRTARAVNATHSSPKSPSGNKRTSNGPGISGRPASTATSNGGNSSQPAAVRAMPSLPVRVAGSGTAGVTGVIDPEESEATQKLRVKVHDIRVKLIRAARRLGYEHDSGLVKQVLYRLYLAEKLKEPFRKGSRRPDAALLAARDATRLEAEQVKKAFKQHQPDLVLYVDRFDQPTRAGGELPVLQAVTNTCGPAIWLNTIVALTHAGSLPPSGAQGHLSWDGYSQQRSQLLQLIIRSASGDARLMNPIAFGESHPGSRRNAQGQAIIPSGLPWKEHMLVLIMSAKLLADAEAALQMSPDASSGKGHGAAAGLDPASMRQLMGRPDGPPVRYLMTQLTAFSQPLMYPDHAGIMELRTAKQRLRQVKGWRNRKELSRQIRFRLLQMQQMTRRQHRTADLLCKATRAGGKLQLAPPRTARGLRPSVQPPMGHRYRALEPGAGWVGPDQLLSGAPYRLSSSASAGKEQLLMQAAGAAAAAHVPTLECFHKAAGAISCGATWAEHTSGAAGTPDMLVVLKMDSQRRGFPFAANNPAVGVLLARLAQECRLHRGPLATGLRLQDCVRLSGPGGAPVELDMAVGKLFSRSTLGQDDDAWGANAELRTDARQLVGSRYSSPVSLSGSVMGQRGDTIAAVSAAVQLQRGRRSAVGGKVQLNNRGAATVGVQVRSDGSQWLSLVGLVPLVNLVCKHDKCICAV